MPDEAGEEAGEDGKVEKGTVARTCFRFSPLVAPVKVGVCFVRKVPEQEALVAQITAQELTPAAISLRRWGAEMGS